MSWKVAVGGAAGVALLLPVVIIGALGAAPPPVLVPSPTALADIPADVLALYRAAAPAACPGLSWTILAGIGKIESDHGRSTAPGVQSGANFAGAEGPMQFEPGTWAQYGDGNPVDVYIEAAAIPAAAKDLCANGAGDPATLYGAIFAYNHDDTYVNNVLAQAAAYGAVATPPTGTTTAAELLANPNLVLPPGAQQDLKGGVVDQRVMDFLAWALQSHTITISVFKTGHTQYVEGTDRLSNHFFGRAADIASIDNLPVTADDPAAKAFAQAINSLTTDRPDEVGTPWGDLATLPGFFIETPDHIHVGWSAAPAS